jgi:glucan endo-1,3-alpha-glucosidase
MTVSSTPSTGQSAPSSGCSTPCAGDSTQTCGGGNRIMVYTHSSAGTWRWVCLFRPVLHLLISAVITSFHLSELPSVTHICSAKGCYTDSSTTRVLGSHFTTSSSNTPASCEATCLRQGYTLAGVEYGSQCFCSRSITFSSGGGSLASTSDCNMACSGDSSQTCGARDRIFIYSYTPASSSMTTTTTASTSTTTTPSDLSVPTWSSLGCYQDSSSRILSSYSTTSSSNTPAYCQQLCSSMGYSFAGTEHGRECYCANSITGGASTIASSNCNSACAGNSALTCGGGWAINIYQLSATSHGIMSRAKRTSSKVVVAHFIVGNSYSYTKSTWSSNIHAAIAGGIDGFALNVGGDSWQPQRVSDAYAAASGTSFKLFLSFDMTYVSLYSYSQH